MTMGHNLTAGIMRQYFVSIASSDINHGFGSEYFHNKGLITVDVMLMTCICTNMTPRWQICATDCLLHYDDSSGERGLQ